MDETADAGWIYTLLAPVQTNFNWLVPVAGMVTLCVAIRYYIHDGHWAQTMQADVIATMTQGGKGNSKSSLLGKQCEVVVL